MKKLLLSAFISLTALVASAQKQIYIPYEWRQNRTDTLLYAESDPDNKYTWSKSRSIESDNFIIYWDKYYGSTAPNQLPSSNYYYFDLEYLKQQAEKFFDLEINTLGFVDPVKSNVAKYKIMILLNHTDVWTCYGGGYDYQVPALWLNPATCKPVGQAVAHEIGHSFHYMCYSEASNHGALPDVSTGFHNAIGSGAGIWEQTAQWQSIQSFPELMYDQSIGVFRNSHNYANSHEWHRYQSYWFFYYLVEKYGITIVADVWNQPETGVYDFNEALMDLKGLSLDELQKMYLEYAMKTVTWDFAECAPYRDQFIGDFTYSCAVNEDGAYQVSYASCPQSTGFNAIPLSVPEAGSEVTVHFTALRNASALADADPAQYLNGESVFVESGKTRYNANSNPSTRAFRMGFVALLNDGTRKYFSEDKTYCTGAGVATEDVSMTVPENTKNIWLVVTPTPTKYIQHKWDDNISNDDMWPYEFTIDGTTLSSKATVYMSPVIDGREIADATFTYDVYFPADSKAYSGTNIVVGGEAAATLGTAFQFEPSEIQGKMQAYSAVGPGVGKVMFYAAKATDGELIKSGSTANGYGHWFDANGNVVNYGTTSKVYSEFQPSSLSFYIGQYPGMVANGSTYTISQALRYRKTARESATAQFIFNIHIDNTKTDAVLKQIEYTDPTTNAIETVATNATRQDEGIYTLTGVKLPNNRSNLPAGIYISEGKKFIVK